MRDPLVSWLRKRELLRGAVADDHLSYLFHSLDSQIRNFSEHTPGFGQVLDERIIDTKGSETVFVLGSGPSICSLTPDHFEEIGQQDSIGFNLWAVHEFVPTHYLLQLSRDATSRHAEIGALQSRIGSYLQTQILVRGDQTFQGQPSFSEIAIEVLQRSDMWFLMELAIHSKVEIEPRVMMRVFESLGLFNYGVVGKAIPKWRGTLGLILSLTYQMGYRNVVLCGIDMNDSSHFFDDPAYQDCLPGITLPPVGSTDTETFESQAYSRNTVSRYVSDFARFARERAGVKLFLASPGSRLTGIIPDWNFGGGRNP